MLHSNKNVYVMQNNEHFCLDTSCLDNMVSCFNPSYKFYKEVMVFHRK